ncbi:MAG: hypothetical protein ACRDA8_19995 [Shewanella sp.]
MQLNDSEYDNELLNQIAAESPTFAALLKVALGEFYQEKQQGHNNIGHEAIWLGSFLDGLQSHTQVLLVITQDEGQKVDED